MVLYIALRYCKKWLWLGLKVGVGLAMLCCYKNGQISDAMLLQKW